MKHLYVELDELQIDYDKEHDFRASIIGPKQNLSLEERIKYYQGKTTTYRDVYN